MNNFPTEVLQTTWEKPMLLRIRANRVFLEIIFDLCGVIEAGMVFLIMFLVNHTVRPDCCISRDS